MKNIAMFIILSFLVLSCDQFYFLEPEYVPPLPPGYVPKTDADFVSFTGTRLEKYYWRMNSSSFDKKVNVVSPRVHTATGSEQVTPNRVYCQLTLHNVPLRVFYEPHFIPDLRVTGELAGLYRDSYQQLNVPYPINFDKTTTRFFDDLFEHELNYSLTHEQYTVSESFENNTLVLPKTGIYENPLAETKYRTYRIPNTKAFLLSFNTMAGAQGFTPYPTDLISAIETFESYYLLSREFYQYKDLTVTYEKDVPLSGFAPSDIVESYIYAPELNSVTVLFKEYDEPFIGTVFSFNIKAEDGGLVQKTIRITP